MSATTKVCFTCGQTIIGKYCNIKNNDTDKVSYLEKVKICVTSDLVEDEAEMYICGLCIRHLRVSFKFRATVLTSQQDLRQRIQQLQPVKVLIPEIKVEDKLQNEYLKTESDSEFECSKSDNYSSDEEASKGTRKQRDKNVEDESLICDFCAAQFTKHWQLRKHLARVHNEHRKFICSYCGKEFKQSYHLKEHITSHTGEKNYSCPICEKKFQRQSSQKRHIKTHDAPPGHKTKRTPFLCTICGKSFPFSNGVQRHMRIHLGIKNFECKLCNRKFTQSTHLHVHMRTHTGEKPYICDTCGEKFSLKSCMLKHINNRHYRAKTLVEEFPIFYLPKDFEQTC